MNYAVDDAAGRPESVRQWRARVQPKERPARDWNRRAACLEEDPEIFFPPGRNGPWWEPAEVCRRCPVLSDCAGWVLSTDLPPRDGYVAGAPATLVARARYLAGKAERSRTAGRNEGEKGKGPE